MTNILHLFLSLMFFAIGLASVALYFVGRKDGVSRLDLLVMGIGSIILACAIAKQIQYDDNK